MTCATPENALEGTVETPELAAIAALIPITLGYRARIRRHPFKTCRRCQGMGRIRTRSGRGRPKPCPRCAGRGIRPRAFRRPQRSAARILDDARPERR